MIRRLLAIPTGTAWLLAAVGAASFLAGAWLGWVELFVVAASCGLVLLVAIPFVLVRGSVQLNRTVAPNRVTVGDRAVAELSATNNSSRRSQALTVDERIGEARFPIEISSLAQGETTEFIYSLPTDRRGKYMIGPASVGRSDPLGLMHVSIGETDVEEFYVHPRVVPTKVLAAGFAKDLEGPTFDSSPAGDVAFHTIREYQPGDDVRHVHWMSTARTNSLMVRHYVDNRRPQLAVLVDASTAQSPAEFERAVEVGASIGVSSIRRETRVAVWCGAKPQLGSQRPGTASDLLDALAVVEPADNEVSACAEAALAAENGTSVLVLVTANRNPADLAAFCGRFRRRVRLVVVSVSDNAQAFVLPGVRVLPAPDLETFANAWNRLA